MECSFHPITHYSKEYKQRKYSNEMANDFYKRNMQWNNLRIKKIKKLYKRNLKEEKKNLSFTPKIRKIINKNYDRDASLVVEDPESYCMYVDQMKKVYEGNKEKIKRENSKPGSGFIWKNKPTKTIEFNLLTEKRRQRNYSKENINKKKYKEPYVYIDKGYNKKVYNTLTASRNMENESSVKSIKNHLHEELQNIVL